MRAVGEPREVEAEAVEFRRDLTEAGEGQTRERWPLDDLVVIHQPDDRGVGRVGAQIGKTTTFGAEINGWFQGCGPQGERLVWIEEGRGEAEVAVLAGIECPTRWVAHARTVGPARSVLGPLGGVDRRGARLGPSHQPDRSKQTADHELPSPEFRHLRPLAAFDCRHFRAPFARVVLHVPLTARDVTYFVVGRLGLVPPFIQAIYVRVVIVSRAAPPARTAASSFSATRPERSSAATIIEPLTSTQSNHGTISAVAARSRPVRANKATTAIGQRPSPSASAASGNSASELIRVKKVRPRAPA